MRCIVSALSFADPTPDLAERLLELKLKSAGGTAAAQLSSTFIEPIMPWLSRVTVVSSCPGVVGQDGQWACFTTSDNPCKQGLGLVKLVWNKWQFVGASMLHAQCTSHSLNCIWS